MKELVKHFKEQPKKAIKEVAMCLAIFVVCGAMLFLSAPFQRVQRYDSNNRHNGTLKFKKSMFNN